MTAPAGLPIVCCWRSRYRTEGGKRAADSILRPRRWFGWGTPTIIWTFLERSPLRLAYYLDMLVGVIDKHLSAVSRIVLSQRHGRQRCSWEESDLRRVRHAIGREMICCLYWPSTGRWGGDHGKRLDSFSARRCFTPANGKLDDPRFWCHTWSASMLGWSRSNPGTPFHPAARGWITKDRSRPGHIGWPSLASPEKVNRCLTNFTRDVVRCSAGRRLDGKSWEG